MPNGYHLDSLENQLVNFAGWDTPGEGELRLGPGGNRGSAETEGALARAPMTSSAYFLTLSKDGQQGQCWCLLLHPQKGSQVKFSWENSHFAFPF